MRANKWCGDLSSESAPSLKKWSVGHMVGHIMMKRRYQYSDIAF